MKLWISDHCVSVENPPLMLLPLYSVKKVGHPSFSKGIHSKKQANKQNKQTNMQFPNEIADHCVSLENYTLMLLPLHCVKKVGQEAPYLPDFELVLPFWPLCFFQIFLPFRPMWNLQMKFCISDHCVSVENPPLMLLPLYSVKKVGREALDNKPLDQSHTPYFTHYFT